MTSRKTARSAFTLIELLVVISIIALLVGLLLPALSRARASGIAAACMSNIRNLEIAHIGYVNDFDDRMIDVGMGHGGSSFGDENLWWINSLERYYGSALVVRSPGDKSPFWPPEEGGTGEMPPGSDHYRRTSYGVNNYLSSTAPFEPWLKYDKIPAPSATVHFVMMAETGDYAGADHPHVENWGDGSDYTPARAGRQLEINAHGGEPATWTARANYGFLDGHVESREFREVYQGYEKNQFNPEVAR